ncbi:hypothetical protein KUTeg_019075 [Tegillarca granosa]|uniref:Beta-lactamase-related domain-containing protein n=1 Tax=Tegillarca granosa TaxID=220873 RepID=A0ABQ9EBG0_TEGGR|nr:hypothetical protein KUTeg_019075 [Tegillarca granosa]
MVKDGQTVFAKGYGVIDLVTKRPVTNTTIFQLASMSKAFAATLLMEQLHQNKTLSVYSHVTDILGHDFQFSTDIRTKYANLRDLLSHTLGIARNNPMRFDPTLTRKTLPSRVKFLKSIHPFRESFVYNNLMYGLVTRISEILGGKAWEDLINDVIYKPLGMTSSNFATRIDPSRPDLAQGYTNDDSIGGVSEVPFEFNKRWSELCGSTCIMSNALDVAKWMKFHLNGGKNEAGHQIVDSDSLAYIYRPRNTIMSATVSKYFTKPKVPVTTTETSYGFGWKIGYYRGSYRILRHTGSTWGYSSLVTLIPDMNIGIFTSMTGNDHNYIFRALLHNYLSDIALGETPWLNGSTICSFPEPWYTIPVSKHTSVNKNIPLYRDESEYIGSYSNNAYGTLNISHNATLNTLEMRYGFARWALYPKHTHDTFYGEASGLIKKSFDLSTIKFHTGKTHHITSVEVTSFETNDPPVFQKQSHTTVSNSIFG